MTTSKRGYEAMGAKTDKPRRRQVLSAALAMSMGAAGAWMMYLLLHNNQAYSGVLDTSVLFYEAQRSGILPKSNRIWWRGDSGMFDKTRDGRSLVGGYYDAGDTPKFGLPLAVAFTQIAWSLLDFGDGYNWDQTWRTKDAIKWATDYMIKCHTGEYEFYAQVGNGEAEHGVWKRPEDMLWQNHRVGYMVNKTHPGSDVVGATAAAMASASLVFKHSDPGYAKELVWRAQQLYHFGNSHQGFYSEQIPDAKIFYRSSQYKDDLAWGALWLHKATGQRWYIDEAKKHIDGLLQWTFPYHPTLDWNFVGHPVCLMLYKETREWKYKKCVEDFLDRWIGFPKTPRGLSYVRGHHHTSLRNNANAAMMAFAYAKDMQDLGESMHKARRYECWALSQINYMMGEGGRSFIVGYGNNFPKRPHHRGASCPTTPGQCSWWQYGSDRYNPQVLTGALVGGPDTHDGYLDDRTNWIQSEVALDYNAGLMGALARIQTHVHRGGFNQCNYNGQGTQAGGLNKGALIGGIVLALVAAVVGVSVFTIHRRRAAQRSAEDASDAVVATSEVYEMAEEGTTTEAATAETAETASQKESEVVS
ncbi:hypothetical protein BSKO_12855 [Bryopsis sp. KO-2023]|nr:hypothetical protein BSKO_12855 [Bryopsis sp. KO-2023]